MDFKTHSFKSRAIGSTNIVATGFNPLKTRKKNSSAVGTAHIIWAEPTVLLFGDLDFCRVETRPYNMCRGYASFKTGILSFNPVVILLLGLKRDSTGWHIVNKILCLVNQYKSFI